MMEKIIIEHYSAYWETGIGTNDKMFIEKTDIYSNFDDVVHRLVVRFKITNGIQIKFKY